MRERKRGKKKDERGKNIYAQTDRQRNKQGLKEKEKIEGKKGG